jgi:hypothetical protein
MGALSLVAAAISVLLAFCWFLVDTNRRLHRTGPEADIA